MTVGSITRVLIVDDNAAIHADFAKILAGSQASPELDELERLALGTAEPAIAFVRPTYELQGAYQGRDALKRVEDAVRDGACYSLAFVDMRMPPGWDGIETIERLWVADPGLQVVICTAYSDYDWESVLGRLRLPDQFLILKKPFEAVEVLQSANALSGKWHRERELREHFAALESKVQARTATLETINLELESANAELQEQVRLRHAAEVELGFAQKLEAVGRLAAGIAHEINTPIQYVSDSVHFLQSAFQELLAVVMALEKGETPGADIDLGFLKTEVPLAIERTFEGTQRVATIVRAMKEFAHPDGGEKSLADINRALETTLLIARNEYKYVAQALTQFGEIPEINCNVGELSQVFLNLVVNSAHAIADAGRNAESGLITVRTERRGPWVEISIEDNGIGIPAELMGKIYDPFFTTKEVGRGSGQGLAIARSIIIDKHAGKIGAQSAPGVGTRFTIHLPIGGDAVAA